MRRFSVPLLLFLFALSLRLLGLTWGLPNAGRWYSYHPDERQIVAAVASLDIFGGQFNPHFFNYPSLYIYLAAFTHLLLSGFGFVTPAPNASAYWPAVRDIIFAARLVTVLLGALTIPLVWDMARRIGGVRVALVAGLLMALMPGHVQHSHFATVDVPATFFIALCLWLSLRGQLLAAALVAGLAAATKYNAGLVLVAPLWMAWTMGQTKRMPLLVVLAGFGFLIGCPFSVLSFSEFWGDGHNTGFAYELLVHPREGSGEVFQQTGNGWWYHLTFNLPFAMTWPTLGLGLWGVVWGLKSEPSPPAPLPLERGAGAIADCSGLGQRLSTAAPLSNGRGAGGEGSALVPARPTVPFLVFAALYFLTLGLSQVRYLRYTLPLLPVLCLCAALGAASLPQMMLRRAVAVATCGITLIGASNVLYPFVTIDPRDQAMAFLAPQKGDHVPVTVGLVNPPWFWTPPMSPQDAPPGSDLQINGSSDGRFRFVIVGSDIAKLEANRPQCFVMSEFEWMDKERLADPQWLKFVSHLEDTYGVVGHLGNSPTVFSSSERKAVVPHDYLYPNPQVRIYGISTGD